MADESTGTATAATLAESDNPTEGAEANSYVDLAAINARLEQQESYIAQMKGEKGSLVQTLEAAKTEIAELRGRMEQASVQSQHQEPQEDTFVKILDLDDESLEAIRNDPALAIDHVKKVHSGFLEREDRLISTVVSLLDERDGKLAGSQSLKLKEFDERLKKSDLDVLPWRRAIDELKAKSPVFATLDDTVLIAFAKEQNMKPDYTFVGAPGDRSVPATTRSAGKPSAEARALTKATFLKMTGNDEARAEKMTKRHFGEV